MRSIARAWRRLPHDFDRPERRGRLIERLFAEVVALDERALGVGEARATTSFTRSTSSARATSSSGRGIRGSSLVEVFAPRPATRWPSPWRSPARYEERRAVRRLGRRRPDARAPRRAPPASRRPPPSRGAPVDAAGQVAPLAHAVDHRAADAEVGPAAEGNAPSTRRTSARPEGAPRARTIAGRRASRTTRAIRRRDLPRVDVDEIELGAEAREHVSGGVGERVADVRGMPPARVRGRRERSCARRDGRGGEAGRPDWPASGEMRYGGSGDRRSPPEASSSRAPSGRRAGGC